MAYKSLMTVVTDQALAKSAVLQAEAMARALDAHLEVLCLGVDRTQTGYYYAGANAVILQETISRATADAEQSEAAVREMLRGDEIRWSVETGVSQLADIARHIAAHGRFSDMVVLPKPYGKDHGVELEPVVEGALFEGRVPVLVMPDGAEPKVQPQRVLIGWDESAEALQAVRSALPLLTGAEIVRVVVVDPPTHGLSRSDPGGLLSQYLARHGIRCEIDVLSKTLPRVSDVLLRHCADMDADMIVMGAYGHSRFREAILGGATRNMLEQTTVPLLMAH